MKKIFKKSFAVIFLMTLMLLVPIQSLAETKMGETFYFDGQDELYQQFLKERHYPDDIMERYEMWLQANDYFGKDEKDYDPNLVSMDLAKPIWRTSGWTKELIAEFFDTEDKVNFLHQYKEQNKVKFMARFKVKIVYCDRQNIFFNINNIN